MSFLRLNMVLRILLVNVLYVAKIQGILVMLLLWFIFLLIRNLFNLMYVRFLIKMFHVVMAALFRINFTLFGFLQISMSLMGLLNFTRFIFFFLMVDSSLKIMLLMLLIAFNFFIFLVFRLQITILMLLNLFIFVMSMNLFRKAVWILMRMIIMMLAGLVDGILMQFLMRLRMMILFLIFILGIKCFRNDFLVTADNF